MAATGALLAKEIHLKVHQDEYFHATPNENAVRYWVAIGFLCLAAVLLWAIALHSIFKRVCSHRRSIVKKRTGHEV